ncbi:oligosaccharide flippase family protein [Halovenus halobia]|uniref:oligosaccharide flippase family protein n=1 Tax=Halovenus halobia TaxID=3396622 RepID=UPI003F56DBCB
MKLTRKVLVSAFSDVVITLVGFLGTIYFARALGAGPLGVFALGMTVAQAFLVLDFGVGKAAMKRISADNEPSAHFTAAIIVYGLILIASVAVILFFRDQVNSYIGGEFAVIVALIFAFQRLYQILNTAIKGENNVHVRDSIDSVERIVRVGAQALFVYAGVQTLGLFLGYATSFGIAVGLAFLYYLKAVSLSVKPPSKDHFRSIYNFSRYAWLGPLKSRALSWTDITILGIFVASSTIGVYQICWTIAMTFQILGKSISRNLFPEVSEEDGLNNTGRISLLTRQSFVYAGLLPIPGIIGAVVVGERVLGVYGPEFRSGSAILVVLAFVSLLRSYEGSVYSVVNGIDEPQISFISDIIFVICNVVLNLILVSTFGAIGAAFGTVGALFAGLATAFWLANKKVDFVFPAREIGLQFFAAAIMGGIALALKQLLSPLHFVELLFIVGVGAATYFMILLQLSTEIRETVLRIVPYGS